MKHRPVFCASALVAAGIASAIGACTDDDPPVLANAPDGASDAATEGDGGTGTDPDEDGGGTTDAGVAIDAAKDAKVRDANGPGEAGADCFFNHDCALSLRCGACDAGYCFCEPGARGTGRNGIDPCDAGEDCASALCVEGPVSGDHYCSDECETADDCTGMLPRCVTVPFLATFCARDAG